MCLRINVIVLSPVSGGTPPHRNQAHRVVHSQSSLACYSDVAKRMGEARRDGAGEVEWVFGSSGGEFGISLCVGVHGETASSFPSLESPELSGLGLEREGDGRIASAYQTL